MATPLAQSSWVRANPARLAHRDPDVSKHLEIPPPLNFDLNGIVIWAASGFSQMEDG
jgi:hypothetical protein